MTDNPKDQIPKDATEQITKMNRLESAIFKLNKQTSAEPMEVAPSKPITPEERESTIKALATAEKLRRLADEAAEKLSKSEKENKRLQEEKKTLESHIAELQSRQPAAPLSNQEFVDKIYSFRDSVAAAIDKIPGTRKAEIGSNIDGLKKEPEWTNILEIIQGEAVKIVGGYNLAASREAVWKGWKTRFANYFDNSTVFGQYFKPIIEQKQKKFQEDVLSKVLNQYTLDSLKRTDLILKRAETQVDTNLAEPVRASIEKHILATYYEESAGAHKIRQEAAERFEKYKLDDQDKIKEKLVSAAIVSYYNELKDAVKNNTTFNDVMSVIERVEGDINKKSEQPIVASEPAIIQEIQLARTDITQYVINIFQNFGGVDKLWDNLERKTKENKRLKTKLEELKSAYKEKQPAEFYSAFAETVFSSKELKQMVFESLDDKEKELEKEAKEAKAKLENAEKDISPKIRREFAQGVMSELGIESKEDVETPKSLAELIQSFYTEKSGESSTEIKTKSAKRYEEVYNMLVDRIADLIGNERINSPENFSGDHMSQASKGINPAYSENIAENSEQNKKADRALVESYFHDSKQGFNSLLNKYGIFLEGEIEKNRKNVENLKTEKNNLAEKLNGLEKQLDNIADIYVAPQLKKHINDLNSDTKDETSKKQLSEDFRERCGIKPEELDNAAIAALDEAVVYTLAKKIVRDSALFRKFNDYNEEINQYYGGLDKENAELKAKNAGLTLTYGTLQDAFNIKEDELHEVTEEKTKLLGKLTAIAQSNAEDVHNLVDRIFRQRKGEFLADSSDKEAKAKKIFDEAYFSEAAVDALPSKYDASKADIKSKLSAAKAKIESNPEEKDSYEDLVFIIGKNPALKAALTGNYDRALAQYHNSEIKKKSDENAALKAESDAAKAESKKKEEENAKLYEQNKDLEGRLQKVTEAADGFKKELDAVNAEAERIQREILEAHYTQIYIKAKRLYEKDEDYNSIITGFLDAIGYGATLAKTPANYALVYAELGQAYLRQSVALDDPADKLSNLKRGIEKCREALVQNNNKNETVRRMAEINLGWAHKRLTEQFGQEKDLIQQLEQYKSATFDQVELDKLGLKQATI